MEINEQGRIDIVNSVIEHLQRRTVANVTVLLKCHADFLQGPAKNAAELDHSGIQEEIKLSRMRDHHTNFFSTANFNGDVISNFLTR